MRRLKFVLKAELNRLRKSYEASSNQMFESKQYGFFGSLLGVLISPFILLMVASISVIAIGIYTAILLGTVTRYIKRVHKRLRSK